MTISISKEVRLDYGKSDITLNRHTGYATGDTVSLSISANNSRITQRIALDLDEAKALLDALEEVLR